MAMEYWQQSPKWCDIPGLEKKPFVTIWIRLSYWESVNSMGPVLDLLTGMVPVLSIWPWKQQTFIDGAQSDFCNLTCGILRGSILGPLLFTVYINDLPSCNLFSKPRMYNADDTTLTSSAEDPYVLEHKMNYNMNNIPLKRAIKHKSLGVQIDESVNWCPHVNTIIQRTLVLLLKHVNPMTPFDSTMHW